MTQVAHEKCPTLVDIVTATAEKFTTVFFLLGRCHSIYDQLFIDELKVTELGKMHRPSKYQNNNYPHLTHRSCNIRIHAKLQGIIPKFIHIFKNATPIRRSHCPLGNPAKKSCESWSRSCHSWTRSCVSWSWYKILDQGYQDLDQDFFNDTSILKSMMWKP